MSRKYKHQKHRVAARDPEPWLRKLPPELRDNPKSVAWAKAKLESEQGLRSFDRKLVDHYSLHKACPLRACGRAHRCVGRELLCYEETLPLLQKYVFPKLRAALKQRATEAAVRPESPL